MKPVTDYEKLQHAKVGVVKDPRNGQNTVLISPAFQLPYSKTRRTKIEWTPAATPTTLFTGNTTGLDITIPQKSTGRLHDLRVEHTVTETKNAADIAVPVIAPYYLDEIAFQVLTSSNRVLQQYYNDNLILDLMVLKPHQLKAMCTLGNMNTATFLAPAASIPQNSSAVHEIPLLNCLLTSTPIHIQQLKADLKLHLNYRQVYADALEAKSPLRLIGDTLEHTYEERQLHQKQFSQNAHRYTFLQPIRTQQAGTITASTPYLINLDGLPKCKISHIAVIIRASRAVAANAVGTWADIGASAKVNVLNDVGDKVLSNTDQTYRELKYAEMPKQSENEMLQTLNPVIINFARNIKASYAGVMDGFLDFPGSKKYQIQITPDAAWTSGDYVVDVYAYTFQQLMVHKDGELAVTTL